MEFRRVLFRSHAGRNDEGTIAGSVRKGGDRGRARVGGDRRRNTQRRSQRAAVGRRLRGDPSRLARPSGPAVPGPGPDRRDRKSVVEGKMVSVRVELGGRRIVQTKKNTKE